MPSAARKPSLWVQVPVIARAVIVGIVVGMVAANVWPILLLKLGVPLAAVGELVFLAVYVWWASGGGPPRNLQAARADCFRAGALSGRQWFWGVIAAVSFAATVHAAIVVLFRFVPYPAAAFHRGYDFSFIPTRSLQWVACVISALSAGVCEETGFRGYMQRPIEHRHGPAIAILISSLFFTLIHLTKDWALAGIVPIVFGAGVLLGMLAHASRTLVFGMIGHTIMDIGLFAFWWTQIAGTFTQRPISATGVDLSFLVECGALLLFLAGVLGASTKLRSLRSRP